MAAYYNEHDPFAAAWLRELIKAELIADGEVDERDIRDVEPDDLRGFTQCHFFAGIGVWSYALRNAGWPDDHAVWTGSCPCQSFSASGKREGFSDERHLWPAWQRLILECRPDTVFGEQVAGKDGLAWFDIVSSDLEAAGYAVGACDTCAAGYGAPHIRQRLYFVANGGMAQSKGERERTGKFTGNLREEIFVSGRQTGSDGGNDSATGGMAHSGNGRRSFPGDGGELGARGGETQPERNRDAGDMGLASRDGRQQGRLDASEPGALGLMADAASERCGEAGHPGGRFILRDCGSGTVSGMADAMRDGTGHASGGSLRTQAAADGTDGSLPGQGCGSGIDCPDGGLADNNETGKQQTARLHVSGPCGNDATGCSTDGLLADAADARRTDEGQYGSGSPLFSARPEQCGGVGELGISAEGGWRQGAPGETVPREESCGEAGRPVVTGGVGNANSEPRRLSPRSSGGRGNEPQLNTRSTSTSGELGDTHGAGHERSRECHRASASEFLAGPPSAVGRMDDAELSKGSRSGLDGGSLVSQPEPEGIVASGILNGFWRDAVWIWCRDQKYRPAQPAPFGLAAELADKLALVRLPGGQEVFFPLAEKSPNRVGRLRGYGNSLCASQAQAFIEAYMELLV